MEIEILEINFDEVTELDPVLSEFDLWWSDLEEACVTEVWIAKLGDQLVGFLCKNIDGYGVSIEVAPKYQSKGIGLALCREASCFRPERDKSSGFWSVVRQRLG